MFVGQYTLFADNRERLFLPRGFRKLLNKGAYITRGLDENLLIMTVASFQTLYKRIQEMNIADPSVRVLRHVLLSTSYQISLDHIGRFSIPQILSQNVNLEHPVVIIGSGEYLEIWEIEKWIEQSKLFEDEEVMQQKFTKL
jgi:MraZ protein